MNPAVSTIGIGGMSCSSCVARVERTLKNVPGVQSVSVNLANESAHVVWNQTDANNDARLRRAIRDAGYEPLVPEHWQNASEHPWKSFVPIAVGAMLSLPLVAPMLGDLLGKHWMLPAVWQFVFATPVQFVLGARFYKAGWHALRAGSGNMDLLVALGTTAAWALSMWLWQIAPQNEMPHLYFEASSLVITLVLLGKFLEKRAKHQTTEAIRALNALRPAQARVIGSNGEVQIPIDELLVGDRVAVLPGERIPADGLVEQGQTQVNEAMLTGEPLPVTKLTGARLTGGSVNGEGRIVMQVTAIGTETVLSQIIRLVENAQAAKAPIQRLVDRVAEVFVPVVVGVALITFFGWWWHGQGVETALINSVAVLVMACPCALGLATPAAIMAGTGIAAKQGILIKDAQVLEHAQQIDTVAFDKTGTLTLGQPRLLQLLPLTSQGDARLCLSLAASLQSGSEHPLARAVLYEAKQQDVPVVVPDQSRAVSGRGIQGELEGCGWLLGSVSWLQSLQAGMGDVAASDWLLKAQPLLAAGSTVSVLAKQTLQGWTAQALLVFGDEPKPGVVEALQALRLRGLRLAMISGDNTAAAHAMAQHLGLRADEVFAEVMPGEKAELVKRLQYTGSGPTHRVAFVGDGINDAPALAAADVGFAMANPNGGGTDVAMQAAGITLMRGDVNLVIAALDISHRTVVKIRQNLFWAFVYNVAGIPLAALGYLSPVVAGAAMALSSVSVMTNALLLKRWHWCSTLRTEASHQLKSPLA